MKKFKYGFLMEWFYKFANIPVSLLLAIHFFYILLSVSEKNYLIFPLLIYIIIFYLINRHYYKSYKLFPYVIEIDNEKMICKDFVLRKNEEIKHADIMKIEGSIFTGNPAKPLYITTKDEIRIGIYSSIRDYDKLLTIILSNVNKELYEDLIERVKNPKSKKKK